MPDLEVNLSLQAERIILLIVMLLSFLHDCILFDNFLFLSSLLYLFEYKEFEIWVMKALYLMNKF